MSNSEHVGIPRELRRLNLPFNIEEYIVASPPDKRRIIINSILTSKSTMSPLEYDNFIDKLGKADQRELEYFLNPSYFPEHELPYHLYGVSPIGLELPEEEEYREQIIYPEYTEDYEEEIDVIPSLVPLKRPISIKTEKEDLAKEIREIRRILNQSFIEKPSVVKHYYEPQKMEVVHRYQPSITEYKKPGWSLIDTTVNGDLELYKKRDGYAIVFWGEDPPLVSHTIYSFDKAEREYDRLKNMYGVY